MNYRGHCDRRKWTLSRWQWERETVRLNQGESLRPPCNLWVYAILHTDSSCKGTQTAHCMQAHTLRPHRCSSASETRKSGSPPFHRVRGQKKKTEYESTACPFMALRKFWGCIAARSVFFSSFLYFTAELSERISTRFTDRRTGNPDMGM